MQGLVIAILGVWRITHLLHAEEGPGRLFARLREGLGRSWAGQAFACFYCLSMWVAIPFAFWLGGSWSERLLLWPALSGAAILLERVTDKSPPPVHYLEDPLEEEQHVQLRK